MKDLKVFISMPMANLDESDIDENLALIQNEFVDFSNRNKDASEKEATTNDFIFLNGKVDDYENLKPLECLGKSLKTLAGADMCVFSKGWKKARGCKIEHACCKAYQIPILYLDD